MRVRGPRALAVGAAGFASVALLGCGQETPRGAEAIQDYSEVGDCLRPDPATLEGYLQAGCDDAEATVEIIETVPGSGTETPPVCPPGTDLLVESQQGPVVDGDIAAVPETWCLRNLEPPHPGDPGQGGGELVPDDCFAVDVTGRISEVACDGGGRTPPQHRVLAIAETADACPDDTEDPIELDGDLPRVLCSAGV